MKTVAKSIETYGWTNPILVDEDGQVIAGHARLEAAKLLGMAQVPTICLTHMTPAQKRAYIIADNRMNEIAGSWDRKIGTSLLSSVRHCSLPGGRSFPRDLRKRLEGLWSQAAA